MIDKLMNRLIWIAALNDHTPDSLDLESIRKDVERKLNDGWDPNDIVALLRNCEEINPHLDETTACRRMAAITAKYKKEHGIE